jgi:8-oxo-dGTP pyrophosphatase MutT (NUDIX family)
MQKATLVFLQKGNKVLLAMKKRGFGKGKYNGVGGKPEKGETLRQTATREAEEEIGVRVKKLKKMAVIKFHFDKKDFNGMEVTSYITRDWEGEPTETEEMKPKWFSREKLPFNKMWPDDKFWLPLILRGVKVKGEFYFDKKEKIKSFYIQRTIEKKTWPEMFQLILDGNKTFDARLADFEIGEGDTIILREWDPKVGEYTGRAIKKKVGYILKTNNQKFWSKKELDNHGLQIISLK